MPRADFGIHGMGLAGAVLTWELLEAGASVVVADTLRPGAASPIAPGLVNPLAGRKLRPDVRLPQWHAALMARVAEWEPFFGQCFWRPTPIIRFLESPKQAAQLDEARADPNRSGWIGETHSPSAHAPAFADTFGSFTTVGGGWFDIPGFLAAMRSHPRLQMVEAEVLEEKAERIIDCRGWRSMEDPRWAFLPWNPARGELIEVELSAPLEPQIWNRGVWLRPIEGQRWLCGATYAWDSDHFADPPTNAAAASLLERLSGWLQQDVRVVERFAGVRSVVTDYRPVLGAHSDDPRLLLFNGLGSKGALLAPTYARALCEHLLEETAIPPEVDLRRFQRAP